MSKNVTWRTHQFWQKTGGLLIKEFVAVKGNQSRGKRAIDGVIVLNEQKGILDGNTYDLEAKDVIVVQTKGYRLGMYHLGQAYFRKFLIQKHMPRSIRRVAICSENDEVMQYLADEHGVEVVVIPEEEMING